MQPRENVILEFLDSEKIWLQRRQNTTTLADEIMLGRMRKKRRKHLIERSTVKPSSRHCSISLITKLSRRKNLCWQLLFLVYDFLALGGTHEDINKYSVQSLMGSLWRHRHRQTSKQIQKCCLFFFYDICRRICFATSLTIGEQKFLRCPHQKSHLLLQFTPWKIMLPTYP